MKILKVIVSIIIVCSIIACQKNDEPFKKEETGDFYYIEKIERIENYIEELNTITSNNGLKILSKELEEIEFIVTLNDKQDYLSIQLKKRDQNYVWSINGYSHFENTDSMPRILNQEFILEVINTLTTEKLTKQNLDDYFAADSQDNLCGCGLDDAKPEETIVIVKTDINEKGNSFELEIYYDSEEGWAGYFSLYGSVDQSLDFNKCIEELENTIRKWEVNGDKKYYVEYFSEIKDKQTIRITFICSDFANNDESGFDNYNLSYSNMLEDEDNKYNDIDIALVLDILDVISNYNITKEEVQEFLLDASGQYDAAYTIDLIEKEYNKNYNYEENWNLMYWLSSNLKERFMIFGPIKKSE